MPAFEIGRYKVTNAQYLRFVLDGATPPPFWLERDGRWWLRRMFDDVPLPAEAPVYVTHRQAGRLRRLDRRRAAHRSAVAPRGLRR